MIAKHLSIKMFMRDEWFPRPLILKPYILDAFQISPSQNWLGSRSGIHLNIEVARNIHMLY